MVLTPDQQTQYYKEQGTVAAPLSPNDWLAKQAPPTTPTATTAPAAGPTATTAPIARTIDDPGYDAAKKYLDKGAFSAPQTADQIAEQKRRASQGLIDSMTAQYNDKINAAKQAGAERVSQTDATSVLSGLTGSTEAVHNRNVTTAANQKEIDAINNERATQIAGIYSKISNDAQTEARQQILDATKSAEEVVARRKATQTEALTNIKALAGSGAVDFDTFKNNPKNEKVYQYALDAAGGSEDALKGIFMASRPQDQLVGAPQRVGDHFIQAYKNPLTGKVSYDTIQVPGLGMEYTNLQKLGDNLISIPTGWDGDVSKLKTIVGPSTAESSVQPGDNPQLYSGLTSKTATAVRGRVGNFKTEPAVQNFATVQDGYNFAKSLKTDTKNPADDQALIYALAKALDPGSVVREGEYNTAQKYAQSWVAAYGAGVNQAVNGTGFLSTKARENIKNTIEQRYKASKVSYDNMAKQYQEGINSLTGRSDGSKFLTDYATDSSAGNAGDIKGQVAAAGYDYDQMKADGHSDEEIKAAIGLK